MNAARKLPSQLKQPRTYRSRPNPFADDWPWITSQLERRSGVAGPDAVRAAVRPPSRSLSGGPAAHLAAAHRCVARPIRSEPEVMFPQVHEPGEAAQSDFTYMNSLGVTLGGVPFPHLVYHLVLVYSNIEAVQICFSESFEALVEGFETLPLAARRRTSPAPHRSSERGHPSAQMPTGVPRPRSAIGC